MSDYIEIGAGEKLYKGGLKDFDEKSFISFIESNQKAGRINSYVDAKKAWKLVEKHTKKAKPEKGK